MSIGRPPARGSPAWACYTWRFQCPGFSSPTMTVCTPKEFTRWPTRSGRLGDVTIVAPHIEASAIGHALTLRRPLRMEELRDGVYEVDGTPTDCVNVALHQAIRGACRISSSPGINKGSTSATT